MGLIARAVEAFRTGGVRRLSGMTRQYFQRRWYRAQALRYRERGCMKIDDMPAIAMAGCMYRTKVRIQNISRIATWNDPSEISPRYAVAARVTGANGFELVGPHTILPEAFKPGDIREVNLTLETPRRPGEYKISIDLVREGCYWFQELHNRTLDFALSVKPHSDELMSSRIPAVDVTLDVTNKCPLKCIQCRKTYFETFDEQQDMNFALYRQIAEQVFPYARHVSLSSAGEPLMTRNFLDAIEIARNYGVQEVSFISSGLHLNPARAERIVDLGVTRIEFSLDGASEEVYNKIRVGSRFDKVIKNIAYLNEIKKRKRAQYPMLRFNFVLMKSNIHELPDFIDLARSLDVDEVQTQHMIVFMPHLSDEALIFDRERSNRYLLEAKERAGRYGIRFFHPPLFDLNEPAPGEKAPPIAEPLTDGKIWISEDEFSFERKTHPVVNDGMQLCTDPWRKIYIDWQGLVFPCCVWKEEPLGDLRLNSFREIWESPRYLKLREGLTTGNLGKSCANCSAITGGDINAEKSYFFDTAEKQPQSHKETQSTPNEFLINP